jgi:hypothetical protein
MSYKLKLEGIKTVKELFDFREELNIDAEKYSKLWGKENNPSESDNLKHYQEANYYYQRVVAQIEYLEKKGVCLAQIEIPKQEDKTPQYALRFIAKTYRRR